MPTVEIPGTEDELRQTIADQLGLDVSEVGDQDDLVELGMDSVTMMMLVGRWQRRGLDSTVLEFAELPTISAWWETISRGH